MSTADGGALGAEIPAPVAEIAGQRGFGALLDSRQDVSVGRTVGIGCGGCLVCIAVAFGIGAITAGLSLFSAGYTVLHALSVGVLFAGLGLGTYGLRGLIQGPRTYYLYSGGIVRRLRSGVAAIAWPEAARMVPVYGKKQESAGKVLGYRLDARDGTSFVLTLALVDGRDGFLDQVIEHVRRNGGVVQ